MTIMDVLVASNGTLNKKTKGVLTPANVRNQAKKNINTCTVLLMKGYTLTHDLDAIMAKYKMLKNVPNVKESNGDKVTPEMMQDLFEEVYPRTPKNHLVMIMVQDFADDRINFINNGHRGDVIKALENLAKELDNAKPMKG